MSEIRAMRRLTFVLCALCFVLCGCDDNGGKSSSVAEQKCPNPNIRVEMDGNLLEFKRDEVWRIYIPNPDKADTLRKYKDVSKDCDIEFQEGVEIVSDIKNKMAAVLSLGISNQQKGSYVDSDYREKLEKYSTDIVKYDHGVLQVVTGEKKGFFVLTETDGLEINGDPIGFECSLNKCSTNYIHPSGLLVSTSVLGWAKTPFLVEKLKTINQKIDSLFITAGEE